MHRAGGLPQTRTGPRVRTENLPPPCLLGPLPSRRRVEGRSRVRSLQTPLPDGKEPLRRQRAEATPERSRKSAQFHYSEKELKKAPAVLAAPGLVSLASPALSGCAAGPAPTGSGRQRLRTLLQARP